MNFELLRVLILLAACIVMFVLNKPRMDIVALLVIVIMPLCGIVSVPEALAGFSDANILLIAVLFVIGEGLSRTGVAYRLSDLLMKKAGSSESRLLVLLMVAVAALGSVMSSTGVVAIFVPVVLSLAKNLRISPARLMMPLSFAGLISGMLSLVATPPNLVADGVLTQEGYAGLGFFSFTPIGLAVLAAGIVYMLFARRWLRPDKAEVRESRRTLLHLIKDYELEGREHRVRVGARSPVVGKTLREMRARKDYGATVIAVERREKFGMSFFAATESTVLHDGDVLLVDAPLDPSGKLEERAKELHFEALPLRGKYFTDQSQDVGMAEILLPPESELIGKNVLETEFRSVHRLSVIGVRRRGQALGGAFLEEPLKAGDTLLVVGTWEAVRGLQAQARDFLVLGLPAEIDRVAPARSKAPFALLSLGVMIFLMVTGLVPNVIAALIGCLLMGAFRCVDLESAYKSIHWPVLLLIVGMMPFATALQNTGGIELAADGLLHLVGAAGPSVVLASLFVFTALTGLFISNTATAVLMAPVAIGVARHLEASPYPFAITVALAASAAFMTPISSPVNMLVMGPGRYRFMDFVRIGVPFTIIVLVITVWLVPVFFPLYP